MRIPSKTPVPTEKKFEFLPTQVRPLRREADGLSCTARQPPNSNLIVNSNPPADFLLTHASPEEQNRRGPDYAMRTQEITHETRASTKQNPLREDPPLNPPALSHLRKPIQLARSPPLNSRTRGAQQKKISRARSETRTKEVVDKHRTRSGSSPKWQNQRD